MSAEESFGAVTCDVGSGRLGETLQHDDIGTDALILLGAVSAMLSIIAAIFGQCGSHGWPGFADP
jgi:hypothetical protein